MPTDFSSLDKLVEFGLGIGIATQMMNTMNHSIANMAVPGVGINPGVKPVCPTGAQPACEPARTAACEPRQYYIVKDEHLAGPLTEAEVGELVRKGVVGRQTFCWYSGLEAWKFAEDIPEINKLLLLNS